MQRLINFLLIYHLGKGGEEAKEIPTGSKASSSPVWTGIVPVPQIDISVCTGRLPLQELKFLSVHNRSIKLK